MEQLDEHQAIFERAMSGRFGPYPYQQRLATAEALPSVLDVATGLGKTAAVVLAWVYRRRFSTRWRDSTPRRLVYCLPMRTLVEQTHSDVVKWLGNLGLLDGSTGTHSAGDIGDIGNEPVGVHLLMGGEDASDWAIHPERDAVLIGTQDMLLSRALNRGYGMIRYRWPMEFGLLNNDCLWVMDETQLMGNGLATTTQLECFGKIWGREKRCHFLWMSATIGKRFFATTDREECDVQVGATERLDDCDRAEPAVDLRLNAAKTVSVAKSIPAASTIVKEHQAGRISLVIANTVPSAKNLFSEIKQAIDKDKRFAGSPSPEVCLLHGRFRPVDRRTALQVIEAFDQSLDSSTGSALEHPGLVIVSTQVVEAGFDISSYRLWSEIAPWSSVIQRLGRLNREGLQPGAKATFWMPKEDKDVENHPKSPNAKRIGPYEKLSLKTAKKLLDQLTKTQSDTSAFRETLQAVSATDEAKAAFEMTPEVVIRPRDFHELFAAEADLEGGFTDVSHFIRSTDRNADAQVFWRDIAGTAPQESEGKPIRDELCNVPVYELRRFISQSKARAFEWNAELRTWQSRRAGEIQPGMTLLIPTTCGGYSESLGWTGNAKHKPTVVGFVTSTLDALDQDADSSSQNWLSLAEHLRDVEAEASSLASELLDDQYVKNAISVAGKWHDWGKSLDRWQDAVKKYICATSQNVEAAASDPAFEDAHDLLREWRPRFGPPNETELWAKFPDLRRMIAASDLACETKQRLAKELFAPFQPNHRHEAASALAAFAAWRGGAEELSALAVYLIACHHGKVRCVLRRRRFGSEVFGLEPSDVLRSVPTVFKDDADLRFDCTAFGASGVWDDSESTFELSSPSWVQMVGELLGASDGSQASGELIDSSEPSNLGPIRLAYYETLICAADIRASRTPGAAKR